jgi:hypothetical protein
MHFSEGTAEHEIFIFFESNSDVSQQRFLFPSDGYQQSKSSDLSVHILTSWFLCNRLPVFLDCLSWAFLGPNVVVEWLTLLLRIQEVSGSDLNLETGYRD